MSHTPPCPAQDKLDDADRLAGLHTRAVRIIREATGLHESFAVPIADAILEGFRTEYGGERIYIPKNDRELFEKVLAKFNGRNREQVLKDFGISKATFYRALNGAKLAANNRGSA